MQTDYEVNLVET